MPIIASLRNRSATRPSRPAVPARARRSARGQSLVEFAFVVPVALMLFVAVADLARLYTAMITIESAAREAADFGAYGSDNWRDVNVDRTIAAMKTRACVASQSLTGFVGPVGDCANPTVDIQLLLPNNAPADSSSGCEQADRPGGPCKVQVDLEYTFDLLVPIGVELADGQRFGFPQSLTFTRRSVFATSDFLVAS